MNGIPSTPTEMPAGQRTLLLVDDEPNILTALQRTLRRDGYFIVCAGGGHEALELMATHEVDVVISDQRMPNMTGVEFLREAKHRYPHTVRMVLSGYSELTSITDAINEGAIYKFLLKPWDDEQIRAVVADAFKLHQLSADNRRLTVALAEANQELQAINERLQTLLAATQHQLTLDETTLAIAHEVLYGLPLPLVGISSDQLIVFANAEANAVLGDQRPLLGDFAADRLAPAVLQALAADVADSPYGDASGVQWRLQIRSMGARSNSRGQLLWLIPNCEREDKSKGNGND